MVKLTALMTAWLANIRHSSGLSKGRPSISFSAFRIAVISFQMTLQLSRSRNEYFTLGESGKTYFSSRKTNLIFVYRFKMLPPNLVALALLFSEICLPIRTEKRTVPWVTRITRREAKFAKPKFTYTERIFKEKSLAFR